MADAEPHSGAVRGVQSAQALNRYVALDSLRGVAALGVVFHHCRAFGYIASLNMFAQGRLFVDFFFVLSGFVISAAYGKRLAEGFSRTTFLFLRWGRVYPLHIAIIAVFVIAELLVMRPVLHQPHSWFMALRAAFLLDGFFGLGNFFNGVSWSISVEMVMYGLAALLFGKGRTGVLIAGGLVLTAICLLLLAIDLPIFSSLIQRGIVGFGCGCGVYWLHCNYSPALSRTWASLAEIAAIAAAVTVMSVTGPEDAASLLCVPVFACVVFVFALDRGVVSSALNRQPFMALGLWSYSIYMIHLLFVSLAGYALAIAVRVVGHPEYLRHSDNLEGLRRVTFDPWIETGITIAVCLVVVAAASVTYRWIEEPGRSWAKRKARRAHAPAAEYIAPTI
ncbi:MAG: acyltransferase family protein [Tsuneonella sp.]